LSKKKLIIEFLSPACRQAGSGSPRAVVYNLSAIIITLAIIPTAFLERFPTKCIWKSYILPIFFHQHCPTSGFFSGCNCPGCGLTRGVSRILHGDIKNGLEFNKLSIIVLAVMLVIITINALKIKKPRQRARA
jgi:hypothetical protein